LDEHTSDRVERLKRKRDWAKLVRRHDIPNGDGQLRPVGIPAVEDKLMRMGGTARPLYVIGTGEIQVQFPRPPLNRLALL
jgi:hypothetical protein